MEFDIPLASTDLIGERTPEQDLVERAKQDPEAFALLYRRNYAAIRGYVLRRVGDRSVCDDLVAEVFMTALKKISKYRHRGVPIRAWLYRIAANIVNRWARKHARRQLQEEPQLEPDMLSQEGPFEQERLEQLSEVVRKALLTLPSKFQMVIALYYFEGLSVESTAQVIGCRVGTVKSRLARGRRALRETLGRR